MRKRAVWLVGSWLVVVGAWYLLGSRSTPDMAVPPGSTNALQEELRTPATATMAAASSAAATPPGTNGAWRARAVDATVNPYAAALREPGESKREWDAGFLSGFQNATNGQPIQFELTQGRVASGVIRITQYRNGELSYLSGELTTPETGKFFFLKPPQDGMAGKAVGVVEFPASQTAYRIEPTGPNGDPELWQRRLDEVLCLDMPRPAVAGASTNVNAEITPLRPDAVPGYVPSYNSNVVSLQSYPGSRAVLLLDFFGGYTPTWGGVTYVKPAGINNSTIRDVWKRVAEDYQPFNINVTTDLRVYQAAAETSRQRCCFTDTPVTAAGVAYIGSWNWGGDTPCWSVYTTGKSAAEVAAHEPGHTLGLGHQGEISSTVTNEYYGGHGSGATGWAPIMGVGYYQPVSSWSKGEYQDANNHENELNIIVTKNNSVTYRADDTGGTLATARYLEIYPDYAATAEGLIERTGDTDAFQFTTSGGQISLTAKPVADWADLAVMAALADANGTIIASDLPQSKLSAKITATLAAGTYTFRVTGTGRNDPVTDGFSSFASLGYYSVVGFVAGGRLPTRLSVVEHAPNGTLVGAVPASSPSDPLAYAIVSGNTSGTFALDSSGNLQVANHALLDYNRLATNSAYAVQFDLFVNITNLNDAAQTELNRRVVVEVLNSAANQPIAFTGFNAGVIVPYDATPSLPKATGFDIANAYCLYQAGLDGNTQVGGSGGEQGLPASGIIFSQVDGTRFQLGPYGGLNTLLLGYTRPRVGTLTFAAPQAYNSLAILASSANGGGVGTLVLNFTNGTKSQVLNFNAQDWYNTVNNVAVQGCGRLRLGQGTLETQDAGWNNPNLYQTTLDLAALGINQAVASITFTDPNVGGNQDAGVFGVSGTMMPPEAAITRQPESVTNNVPTLGATFTAAAMGAPPLRWQWYFSASGNPATFAPLDGQTNATLVLNPVLQDSDAGSYRVVVTNDFSAATSSAAKLTLQRAPIITLHPSPANLFLYAGRSITLSGAGIGALPLSYAWLINGETVPGGTAASLVMNNLQVSQTGNYALQASNAFGVATSSVVSLTIVATTSNSAYADTVIVDHPLGYWRLNERSGSLAHDYLAGKNGTYLGVTLGAAGYNPLDKDTAAKFGPSANSRVSNIPIDFATSDSAAFTVEAWVRGSAQTSDAGIITKGTGGGGEQFNLDTGAGNHAYRFFVRDSGGGAKLANSSITPNGTWQHLVGVCDQAKGLVILYVNGVSNTSGTITAGDGLLSSANAVSIGSRQSGTGAYDLQFNGWIDEVAIYNYALPAARVAAHYAVRNNLPPFFVSDPFAKPTATAGQVYSGSVTPSVSDPNGDALTFAKLGGPGWLGIAANGTLLGTPLSANTGTNSFVVRATDATGLARSATMTVNVLPATPITVAASLEGTNLVLNWTGGIAPYQVQMTPDLADPNWQNLGAATANQILLLAPTNAPAFYRVGGQ